MKRKQRRLSLARETVRILDSEQVVRAGGATGPLCQGDWTRSIISCYIILCGSVSRVVFGCTA